MIKRLLAIVLSVLVGLVVVAAPARAEVPVPPRAEVAAPALAEVPVPPRAKVADQVGAVVDEVVARQLTEYQIPGAAVVVVSGGRQVFGKGYGVADVSAGTPVTVDRTGFFMASVAKVFTAEAVQQLVEAGRLDLDVDVNRYLADLRIQDTYPGRPVTLRRLLTHTSGFADTPLGVAVADPAGVAPLGAWLRDNQPPRVRPPGTLAAYDNYGFALAGHIVETVAGTDFASYVDRQILRPLGMTGTTFAQPTPEGVRATLARGYRADGVEARGQYGAMSPTGAGVVTTPADMGRFMLAALRPGNPLTAQHSTQDPRLPGMGYGYEQHPRAGQAVVNKDGDVPGFHDIMALLPETGLGIYVAYNGDGLGSAANFAAHDLVDRIVDRLYPSSGQAPTTAGTGLDAFAGTYRTTRYSHTDFTKLATLTTAVTVGVDGDELTTTGLSADPALTEQHWRQVEPGLFTDGRERIAFRDGVLFSTANPTVAYQKLSWYAQPTLHMAVAVGAVLVLLVGLLWWPIAALVRRRRGRSGVVPRLAVLAGWTTAGLLVAFVAVLGMILGDSAGLDERIFLGDSSLLTIALVLPVVAAVTTAAMLAATVSAWVRGWWRRAGRIGYTGVTASAVALLGVAAAYNLVG
ncbi:serine hydrolase domain-containing protein [Plantactinospora soyae]|uniref:CubicO group peptidase (Beta-lactamase class C family) n=1 Tax=Plantactinospora soyae TaxID=1544732 RepID=A0A927LZN4_9ACTN|nr:serine hydrolase domain-containing protein [Plantactinospora soyae]MBE1485478.1 CubicO group peptidase (beta-lactamase class C family) [Plantactinospora soyae]